MRRAFTLIEVMMVCAVLAILSAVTIPSIVAMRASRERQAAYEDVLRLAQAGRETAIASGHTYTLTLNDGSTVQLQRAEDAEMSRSGQASDTSKTDQNTPTVQIPKGLVVGGASDAASPSSASDPNATDDAMSASLPSGSSLGEVVLDDKPSSSSDFTLHFYPDGRSEGGGFEMRNGAEIRSLVVDRNGIASLTEENLPPATESSWEAGQNEQRATN